MNNGGKDNQLSGWFFMHAQKKAARAMLFRLLFVAGSRVELETSGL